MSKELVVDGFEIVIDFERGVGDPSRVFKAMSGLIDAFQSLDRHLVSAFDVSLNASLVLDEINAGSIRARFCDLISGIPDDAIKDGEWKKVVGHFLLRGKYAVLRWLKGRHKITHRDDVRLLEEEIRHIAEDTDLKVFPAYRAPTAGELLGDVLAVQESLSILNNKDIAKYRYGNNEVDFNTELSISNEVVREVLTKEVVKSSAQRIVKVKKPDYLGQSMWSFQYDGRAIEAKISHSDWLDSFQNRTIDVRPGDSLRVLLYEEISYGYEAEVVHRHYEVKVVYEIISPPRQHIIKFNS